ncbi:MAG TPA: hypothetical protein VLM80_12515 [Anaerolineales bacterium]|nr:hypothetical protein [Anaerolineales bacterium]
MAKKISKQSLANKKAENAPSLTVSILLTLTLVPMVIGILMIGAWALDIELWEDPQAQVIIGFLFILVSFAVSNALQKKWRLAAGWSVLAISDLIILLWLNVTVQIIALILAAIGLVIIISEFINQWKKNKRAEQ